MFFKEYKKPASIILALLLLISFSFSFVGCSDAPSQSQFEGQEQTEQQGLIEEQEQTEGQGLIEEQEQTEEELTEEQGLTEESLSFTDPDSPLSPPEDIPDPPKPLTAHFINVGQGDSIFVQTPNGMNLLIDGGPRSAGEVIVSYLKKAGITSIDIVISTHPHEDHIGGLVRVLQEFEVKEIIDPGITYSSGVFKDYQTLIKNKNIPLTIGRSGMERNLGDELTLSILHPTLPSSSKPNDASIVSLLTYDEVSFVFPGDAEKASEDQILKQNILKQNTTSLKCTILKVGHHASVTSSSQAFLNTVKPEAGVIMLSANNTHGHPHKEIIERLTEAGVKIYRSDLHGHIVITTDGKTYEIKTEIEPTPPPPSKIYVGSIKSDKYHYPTCRNVQTILPENEIWFISIQDAQKQNYTPCGTCKPPQQ